MNKYQLLGSWFSGIIQVLSKTDKSLQRELGTLKGHIPGLLPGGKTTAPLVLSDE
jgi:hypothetical protein